MTEGGEYPCLADHGTGHDELGYLRHVELL
jgi:hypothetical protein